MKINGNMIVVGNIIEHKGGLFKALKVSHVKPGKGGAFAQVELKEITTGMKLNERFRSSESVEKVRLEQVEHSFLFKEGDNFTFMNNKNYEQVSLTKDLIGEENIPYLQDGLNLTIEFYEEKPILITLPEKIVCKVVEADAVVKGQTATSSYKSAVLDNGKTILVPPHIASDTYIVVDTRDHTYVERAKN